MDSPYRRCLVRAGFSSVQQRLKVSHQVDCIVLAILSVHAHCPVFTGASIGLKEPVDVDVVGQRRECHLRTLSSESCYPSLFRGHVHGFRCTRHVVGWSTGARTVGSGGSSTPFDAGLSPAPMVTSPAAPPKIPYGGFSPVRLQVPGTAQFSEESS